jgi:hypothetical protein
MMELGLSLSWGSRLLHVGLCRVRVLLVGVRRTVLNEEAEDAGNDAEGEAEEEARSEGLSVGVDDAGLEVLGHDLADGGHGLACKS